jgi:hypothetical protein
MPASQSTAQHQTHSLQKNEWRIHGAVSGRSLAFAYRKMVAVRVGARPQLDVLGRPVGRPIAAPGPRSTGRLRPGRLMLDSNNIANVVDGAVCLSKGALKGSFSVDTRHCLQEQWYIALRV